VLSGLVRYHEGQDEHGKRRQRSKGGFHTKRDAQRFLTDTLSRLGDGSYSAPSKLTLGEFLEREWLPAVESTLRPLRAATYRSVVKLRIKPQIGHLRLQALSGGHLNGLYRELKQAGCRSRRASSRTPSCTAHCVTPFAGGG
jgi:integrase